MCVVCDFRRDEGADVHRSGLSNGFWPDVDVSTGTIAAELGESRLDAAGDLTTSYTMDVGDTFEGFIAVDDTDFIRIDLPQGVDLEIGLIGSGEGILADPTLSLLDETGAVIATNDDFAPGVTASFLQFNASSSGSHYLSVSAADGGTGGYFLGVIPDAAAVPFRAQDFDRFERQEAFLSPGDTDLYKVTNYYSGTDWAVAAFGTGDLALEDVRIRVLDQNLNPIATNQSTGIPIVSFTPIENGDYYIEITGGTAMSAGSYELRSLANPTDDISSFWSLRPEFYYTLSLEDGDADWRYVDLIGGQEYGFEMYALRDSNVDPFLAIYDESGTFIDSNDDENDDSSSAYLRYTPTFDQRVFVETKNAPGGEPGLYGVSVSNLTDATPLDAITWRDAALPTDDPVKVWFAAAGEVVNDTGVLITSDGFTQEQRQEMMALFRHVSQFADITFQQTASQAEADLQIARGDLSEAFSPTLIGRANPQGSTFYSDGTILLDDDRYWTEPALERGGFMNHVIAHEFGHALGLAHPHDYGGGSRPMHGVRDDGDLGDFSLNQVPFTAMTYNDYWENLPEDDTSDFGQGFLWGFGSLDIAALQQVYGATTTTRTSNSDYTLGRNTWLETIWDSGGDFDRIKYGGAENVTIDLRAADLTYAELGGGGVSYIEGGFSAFVIANGVSIENGFGGRGNDTITGNQFGNKLEGRNGADVIQGREGDDRIFGGLGFDTLYGGAGNDLIQGGKGEDKVYGGAGNDMLYGNVLDDLIYGGAGNDTIFGGQHHDVLVGANGNDTLTGGSGRDLFQFDMSDGTDRILDFTEDDLIDLSGLGLQYSDLGFSTNSANETRVSFGNTIIDFANLAADLDASDFVFAIA